MLTDSFYNFYIFVVACKHKNEILPLVHNNVKTMIIFIYTLKLKLKNNLTEYHYHPVVLYDRTFGNRCGTIIQSLIILKLYETV